MCLSIKVSRPNDVLAEGVHAGLEWAVVHNDLGYRCGYVRIPKGHPWHGKEYDELDVSVHGGLTFAEADVPWTKAARMMPGGLVLIAGIVAMRRIPICPTRWTKGLPR